jgi:hypothetical protein
MAINFSNVKSILRGQGLVGFTTGREAGEGVTKLSTSKRGEKGPRRESDWSKLSTSKRGGEKGPRRERAG